MFQRTVQRTTRELKEVGRDCVMMMRKGKVESGIVTRMSLATGSTSTSTSKPPHSISSNCRLHSTMSSSDCLFCKIIAGDIPSHKVYEDDNAYAFFDINPLAEGHTLVIPKECHASLTEYDGETVAKVTSVIPKIAKAILETTGKTDWNLLQNNGAKAGQAVFHVHFHIIPRDDNDGLGYRWNTNDIDHDAAKKLLDQITDKLE
eukprot:TRINITY_DN3067_c0_g1_i1.p1 TRINITY_DN3067_c0_g1~~TRINITY_DN3067_c0_g1_i1.p1  ORF type:complete len:204 (-),score=60.30 TRINITY_DN3067_c0_g1_i1:3-614(-)